MDYAYWDSVYAEDRRKREEQERKRKYREDCYFYFEDHDMGATIPNCTYDKHEYGDCPCIGCKHVLPKSKVHEIVMNYLAHHPKCFETN